MRPIAKFYLVRYKLGKLTISDLDELVLLGKLTQLEVEGIINA